MLTLIGIVLIVIILSGLASMVPPLIRSIRRSPIKDMREE